MRISDWSSDVCSSDLIPALLEFEDIFDLGMAPGVNQLILVADNGDVRIVAKNLPKQIFLPAVGVLIFVDQDVFESPADLTDDIICLFEQLVHLVDQIRESLEFVVVFSLFLIHFK